MPSFTTFILWLHVSAIALWVGGMFAVSFVAIPVIFSHARNATDLVLPTLQRFQRISREIIFLILLTGIFNIVNAGMARGFRFDRTYLAMLAGKLTLFLIVIMIQAWHTMRLGPAIVSADPDDVPSLRRRLLLTSALNTILSITMILLGMRLRNG